MTFSVIIEELTNRIDIAWARARRRHLSRGSYTCAWTYADAQLVQETSLLIAVMFQADIDTLVHHVN